MTSANKKLFVLLIIFALCSACQTMSRMIDNSGTEFIVEVETNEPDKEAIIQQAIKITQNKLNAVGIDGEVIKNPDKPNQISVKIYGSNDLERLKKFLFTTYQLELKKAVSPPYPSPVQTFPDEASAGKAVSGDQEVLPYVERDDYSTSESNPPPKFVIVEKNAVVTGADIRDAQAYSISDEISNYQISFSLKPEGAARFGEWTGKNINNYIAVVLDKKVQSVAFIKSQIHDQGQIDGSFTKASAEDIALSLRSGYLPATLKIIEEKPFGN